MRNKEWNEGGSVAEKLRTLFEENHGLNMTDETEFRQAVTENLPPQPNAYEDIRQINMGKQIPDKETQREIDRKSTRLNSSHVSISYAVFCLKKKKKTQKKA